MAKCNQLTPLLFIAKSNHKIQPNKDRWNVPIQSLYQAYHIFRID